GSRGDIRTNNEIFTGVNGGNPGVIDIKNGTVTGKPYATLPVPDPGATDPITEAKISNGQSPAADWTTIDRTYSQSTLLFPTIATPTAPAAGAVNYSW